MSDRIRIEIDEYGPAGADGYGFNIEQIPDREQQSPPFLVHFAVTIMRTSSAQAHPPTNLTLTKKVLTWLALYRFPDKITLPVLEPSALTSVVGERNPPGFGYPGTSDFQWYGTIVERVDCPPLRGHCSLTISQAMPKDSDFDPRLMLKTINIIAKDCIARDVLARFKY